jgi:hypothetical protein
MLLFGMILLMDSSKKFDIKEFVKKPQVIIGGVILIVIMLLVGLFGRGGGQDPAAVSIRNFSNRHAATVDVVDKYIGNVRSANYKANSSQVTIILTADKSEIDNYYKEAFKGKKPVKTTFGPKMRKDLKTKLDKSLLLNNLDSDLQSTMNDELVAIQTEAQKIKKANPDKKKLTALMDKIILNTQTVIARNNEPL